MEEIKIYYDKEKEKEIKDEIVFEKIVAGEVTKKSIFLHNAIQYFVYIEIELKGSGVNLKKSIERIAPKTTEEVELEFRPKITTMKPLRAKLKIKINYVIV